MRVLGFMSILYGKEYLRESLLSVVNHVDKFVVAYSANPSHGVHCDGKCPDSESEIHAICKEVLKDKLIWDVSRGFSDESQHRDVRYKYSQGYELILTIDADEVYKEEELHQALVFASLGRERYYGINGYINLWRSFDYACYDQFRPIRIENLTANNHDQNHNCPLTVWHFSTCQSEMIMRYKYKVFGHAAEVRPQWLDSVYYRWTPENQFNDLHVVALGLWNATPYNKYMMPDYLRRHPNFNKKLV